MRALVFPLVALVAGCTFEVAGVVAQDDGSGGAQVPNLLVPDLAGAAPIDGSAAVDFFASDFSSSDLATSSDLASGNLGGCSPSVARVCADASHSARCAFDAAANVWKPTIDRTCPSNSSCSAGYCQPPSGAAMCTRGSDCGSGVCTLFIVGGNVTSYCAAALGAGGMFASCSGSGFDATCASGVCSSAQQCLYPCMGSNDCAGNNCVSIGASIEGATPSILTCTM